MSEQRKTYNDGLARAAQEVARLASFIGLDCDEGAAIAPQVATGTTIRAIFALMDHGQSHITSPSSEVVERVTKAIMANCVINEEGCRHLAVVAIRAMEEG